MDIQNTNWAAEMEQYLKSRINSLTYRALIKDIKVDAEGSDAILKVTIVPLDENITFGAFNIRLAGVESNTKWKKKKKDAYGTVKGYHPKVSEALKERIRKEAGDKLDENDKATLQAAIDAAKKELESEDDDRIKAAYDKLMQDVQPVFAKLYQANGGAAGADAGAGATDGDTEFHQ